jgi:uncharacterized coiled-coil DUF342 family protein
MTTDQRLDRIERILTLCYNAGRRERKRVREMDEKINILINAQIKNEDGFRELREQSKDTNRQMRETFREIRDLFWKTDERINRLDEAQKRTDRKLNELSDPS